MLDALGRWAIAASEDVGTLTLQWWRALGSLHRALPVVGSPRRWRIYGVRLLVGD